MKFSNGNFLEKEKVNLLHANSEPKVCPPPRVLSTYYKVMTLLVFTLFAFFNFQTSKAECPAGYTQIQAFYSTPSGCLITFTYCYGMNGSLHELILVDIEIDAPSNDPSCSIYFESHKREILDAMLIQLAQGSSVEAIFGGPILECPNTTCAISIKEGICYSDWYWDKHSGKWEIVPCDYTPRMCNSTVYVCYTWVNGVKVYSVTRIGTMPIPCPTGCDNNCW